MAGQVPLRWARGGARRTGPGGGHCVGLRGARTRLPRAPLPSMRLLAVRHPGHGWSLPHVFTLFAEALLMSSCSSMAPINGVTSRCASGFVWFVDAFARIESLWHRSTIASASLSRLRAWHLGWSPPFRACDACHLTPLGPRPRQGTLLGLLTACGAELSILKCAHRVVAAGRHALQAGQRGMQLVTQAGSAR